MIQFAGKGLVSRGDFNKEQAVTKKADVATTNVFGSLISKANSRLRTVPVQKADVVGSLSTVRKGPNDQIGGKAYSGMSRAQSQAIRDSYVTTEDPDMPAPGADVSTQKASGTEAEPTQPAGTKTNLVKRSKSLGGFASRSDYKAQKAIMRTEDGNEDEDKLNTPAGYLNPLNTKVTKNAQKRNKPAMVAGSIAKQLTAPNASF